MKITIVPDDKLVAVNGRPVTLDALDWSSFAGDVSSPYDNVQAVQFDTATGQGHVEYQTVVTQPAGRPNFRPGDWLINAMDFEARFAWILPAYNERRAWLDAEEAEKERAQEERTRASDEETRQRRAGAHDAAMRLNTTGEGEPSTAPGDGVSREEFEAALADLNAQHEAKLAAFAEELAKGGG